MARREVHFERLRGADDRIAGGSVDGEHAAADAGIERECRGGEIIRENFTPARGD